MKAFLFVVLPAILLSMGGCGLTNDPLGYSDRAQIRADATVRVAEAHRDEAVGVAHENASASRAWAGTLPIVVLIVAIGSVVAIVVNWQGCIYLERARQGMARARLPVPVAVQLEAQRRGGVATQIDGQWCIIQSQTGRIVSRARLLTRKD